MKTSSPDWRHDGVKVIKSDRLDSNTAQTPGMLRTAAINAERGSRKLWAGTVIINPNAKTGAHHHGALESVIYSDNEAVVVNLQIDAAERVEEVYWIDPIHRDPGRK